MPDSTNNSDERTELSAEDARLLIKTIEQVEKEEAANQMVDTHSDDSASES